MRSPSVVLDRAFRPALLALAFAALLPASACGPKPSPYDRLCKLYEQYSSQPMTDVLAVQIAERVEREIPEVYQDYGVAMQNGVEYRYQTLQEMAREAEHRSNWECEALRKLYPPK